MGPAGIEAPGRALEEEEAEKTPPRRPGPEAEKKNETSGLEAAGERDERLEAA